MIDETSDQLDDFVEDQIEEVIPEKDPEPTQTNQGQKTDGSFFDINLVAEEHRTALKQRLGELTRKGAKADKLEAELAETKRKLEEAQAPKQKELEAPDADLAIENPLLWEERNRLYIEQERQKAIRESELKAKKDQAEQSKKAELQKQIDDFYVAAEKDGLTKKEVDDSAQYLIDVGFGDLGAYLLGDEQGPKLMAHITGSDDIIYALSKLDTVKRVAYVERFVRPKIGQKVPEKKQPEPPTTLNGSRGKAVSSGGKYSFRIES